MDIKWPKAGKYIIAVSGGVDSVALLHMLVSKNDYDLVVAHFNHRLRPDSDQDEALVEKLAGDHRLEFTSESWKNPKVDENSARIARYDFLNRAINRHGAEGIITAHHNDDLIETVVLNLQRGTGRAGLTPFQGKIIRPLTGLKKAYIYEYAKQHGLEWREDDTNSDLKYRRNQVRHDVLPRLRQSPDFEVELGGILAEAGGLNQAIDQDLGALRAAVNHSSVIFPIRELRRLPLATISEALHDSARRLNPAAEINSHSLEAAALAVKRVEIGQISLGRGLSVEVGNDTVTTSVYSLNKP